MPEIPYVERVKTPREFTLDWLHDMGYRGDELPKGHTANTQECVVAAGLAAAFGCPVSCGVTTYTKLDGSGDTGELPRQLSKFVTQFDSCEYPDLEL